MSRFPRLLVGAVLLTCVIGCASKTATSPGGTVAAADVAAFEQSVTIAETLALDYTSLPPCPATSRLCADPIVKARIKVYGQRAHDLAVALRTSPTAVALAAAQAALADFKATIPSAQ